MSWFATSACSGRKPANAGSPSGTRDDQRLSLSQRNRTRSRAFALFAPILALGALCGACSDLYLDRRDTIALSAGDAIAADKAVQTIDPWPPGSGSRKIAFNGQRMEAAAVRYRTNRVTPPRSMTTSSGAPTETQAAAPSSVPASAAGSAPAPAGQ
jgi:hypothetical protein